MGFATRLTPTLTLALPELSVTHFSLAGVLEQIGRFLVGGTDASDLRCQKLPRTPRDLIGGY